MNLVCFSDVFWDSIWQRHQNILTRFPRSWKILFIEPTSLVVLLKEPSRIFFRKKDNIIVVSLPTLPLIDRVRKMRCINDFLICIWLRTILKILHMEKPILLYYEPRFSSLIGKLDETMVIYDCVDDKLAFSGVPKWMDEYIDILVKKSHIIFVTSCNLYRMIKEKRKEDIYLVGNGVDVNHFKKALNDIPIPQDVKELKRPILGYIGMIDDWMDFELIKKVSISYPNFSIVLLGPANTNVKEDVNELKKYTNIFILGKRPYDMLPSYLKAFDIGLIPFKINKLTKSVNPIKLYEYMASGTKVVSTDLPELSKYEDILHLAKDENEFISYIYDSIYESVKKDLNKGLILSEKNTWDSKAIEIMEIILDKYGDEYGT